MCGIAGFVTAPRAAGGGNVRWSVPNDTPLFATADGGVTGQSGTTYDATGNATGRNANLPIQSWIGNAYTYSPLNQVVFTPTDYATTFAAAAGGNPSNAAQKTPPNTGNAVNGTYLIPEAMYLRSFAPWPFFGNEEPYVNCPAYCFYGDNRAFTTSLSVTARITGILYFWMPGATIGSKRAFSDPSRDKSGRTARGYPTISAATPGGNGYALHVEFAGANPLYPGSPDINTKLDFTPTFILGAICYSGYLYGDAFPDAEVFSMNSKGQSTMLLTFTTPGDPNIGPLQYLPGNNNRNMGSFTSQCTAR